MNNQRLLYHATAFLVVSIWGSTFVYTKLLLLAGLSPAQIFTLRFMIAYLMLLVYCLWRGIRWMADSWKDELLMAALGIAGGSLYFLAENGVDRSYFEAGDVHFADLNGDGMITTDDADQTIIGDPNPDIYGNIFTTVAWKRLKLDVNFSYSLGNDVYNYMRSQLEGGSRFMNQTTAMERRWQREGQQTDMPRITFQDPMGNARFSDRWIEDGSYLRLKSATLSYDLPLKSEYIQGLQFWIQGNNLLTFTKYLGSDPEFAMSGAVLGQGIDLGRLGQSRSIVAGVKINL